MHKLVIRPCVCSLDWIKEISMDTTNTLNHYFSNARFLQVLNEEIIVIYDLVRERTIDFSIAFENDVQVFPCHEDIFVKFRQKFRNLGHFFLG